MVSLYVQTMEKYRLKFIFFKLQDSKIIVHLTDSGSSKIGIEPVLTKTSGSSETVKGKVACNICGRKFATSLLASAHEKRYV